MRRLEDPTNIPLQLDSFPRRAFDCEGYDLRFESSNRTVRFRLGKPETEAAAQRHTSAGQGTRRRAIMTERGLAAAVSAVCDNHSDARTARRRFGGEAGLIASQH